jgi:hypothetical protein
MAKKNSMKKRQSRVVDAMRREQKQMEKQKLRERELKERFEEHERKSIGAQQRERRKNLKDFSSLKTTLLETKGGVLKKKKRRERKNQNKIVKGVRVGNATKIKKNVAYKGIVIKDAASKQAVLDMLKAEDRMM